MVKKGKAKDIQAQFERTVEVLSKGLNEHFIKHKLSVFTIWLTEYILSNPDVGGDIQERIIILHASSIYLVDIVFYTKLYHLLFPKDGIKISYTEALSKNEIVHSDRASSHEPLVMTFSHLLERKFGDLSLGQRQQIVRIFIRMMQPLDCDLLDYVKHVIPTIDRKL